MFVLVKKLFLFPPIGNITLNVDEEISKVAKSAAGVCIIITVVIVEIIFIGVLCTQSTGL